MHENLHVPLAEIREEAARLGYPDPGLRIAVRTGDTPPAERAAMKKQSPDLLVTTPESLYLLLTAPSSRALLRGVRTVIVDEVHTLARDKRGSHLSLSLERLDALVTESGGQPAAHRSLGDAAPARPRGATALGSARGPPADGDRRLWPRPRPRGRHRAADHRARGGHERRSDVRHPRPHRGAHPTAPHHARVRQHPQDGRTSGPPAGRAAGRRRRRARRRRRRIAPRGSAPRQPLRGAPANRRDASARRRPARARRDGVARARDRRGAGRAGLPDRLAPRHRDIPPARRVGPTTTGTARRPAGSTRRHATSWSSAPPCWPPSARGVSTCSSLPWPPSTC